MKSNDSPGEEIVTQERKAYADMRTAINCLYLEVEPSIAKSILDTFENYVRSVAPQGEATPTPEPRLDAICANCGLPRGEHAREAMDYRKLSDNTSNVTWEWPLEACPVGPQPFHAHQSFREARGERERGTPDALAKKISGRIVREFVLMKNVVLGRDELAVLDAANFEFRRALAGAAAKEPK